MLLGGVSVGVPTVKGQAGCDRSNGLTRAFQRDLCGSDRSGIHLGLASGISSREVRRIYYGVNARWSAGRVVSRTRNPSLAGTLPMGGDRLPIEIREGWFG